MTRTFRSRVDTWLAAIGIGPGLFMIPVVALVRRQEGGLTPGSTIVLGLALLLSVGLPLWVFLTTTYEITNDTLRVRSGPLRQQIPLTDIVSITTSNSWQSGPALSLRRLQVKFANGRTVLISPADERGFLAALSHAGVKAAQGVSPND